MSDDLNRRIAEELEPGRDGNLWEEEIRQHGSGKCEAVYEPRAFDTDWAAAGALEEEMANRGWLKRETMNSHGWSICFYCPMSSRSGISADIKPRPTAATIAAARALGLEE